MSKFVVDIDDTLLTEAADLFGTSTKVATIRAALEAEINRRKRREFADAIKSGEIDLTYDSRRDGFPAASGRKGTEAA